MRSNKTAWVRFVEEEARLGYVRPKHNLIPYPRRMFYVCKSDLQRAFFRMEILKESNKPSRDLLASLLVMPPMFVLLNTPEKLTAHSRRGIVLVDELISIAAYYMRCKYTGDDFFETLATMREAFENETTVAMLGEYHSYKKRLLANELNNLRFEKYYET